jgi:hypothetical protein
MQRLEVSGAVRHIYIYIVRRQGVHAVFCGGKRRALMCEARLNTYVKLFKYQFMNFMDGIN